MKWFKRLFGKKEKPTIVGGLEYLVAIDSDIVASCKRMEEIQENGNLYLLDREQQKREQRKADYKAWVKSCHEVTDYLKAA